MLKVATTMSDKTTRTRRSLAHAMNNRLNTLNLGMSILEMYDNADVHDILVAMQGDLKALGQLVEQIKQDDDPKQ